MDVTITFDKVWSRKKSSQPLLGAMVNVMVSEVIVSEVMVTVSEVMVTVMVTVMVSEVMVMVSEVMVMVMATVMVTEIMVSGIMTRVSL